LVTKKGLSVARKVSGVTKNGFLVAWKVSGVVKKGLRVVWKTFPVTKKTGFGGLKVGDANLIEDLSRIRVAEPALIGALQLVGCGLWLDFL